MNAVRRVIRTGWIVAGVAVLAVLAGCGERAQTATPAKRADAEPWKGADNPYGTGSWKAGDQKAWEEQMRARAQAQNEYTRTTAAQ